ncbi:MAG: spore protease YyaC [Alkalicoccus sp.]|nr:MAG: spore protease YyaC [Alkalicoccus sp.]
MKTYGSPVRISADSPVSAQELTTVMTEQLKENISSFVVICIGTDRSTGDSLGPLAGTLLKEKKPDFIEVYGTLHEPVHAKNIGKVCREIEQVHPDAFVLAVDAGLGLRKNVGTIVFGEGPLFPGSALNRTLSPVGEAHLTAIVNVSGFMELSVLQNTRLSVVMSLAKILAESLYNIDQELSLRQQLPSCPGSNVLPFAKPHSL